MAAFHHTWRTGSCTCDFPLTCPPGTSSPQHSGGRYSTHCPLFAPFPRLNQSLQGDWVLPWSASEFQVEEEEEEEEEGWRVQVEAVLLVLRKKDMPLEVDFFWRCSDCCWDRSCWLMMIWMSSWGEVRKKRKWAGTQHRQHCPYIMQTHFTQYSHLTLSDLNTAWLCRMCRYCCSNFFLVLLTGVVCISLDQYESM